MEIVSHRQVRSAARTYTGTVGKVYQTGWCVTISRVLVWNEAQCLMIPDEE